MIQFEEDQCSASLMSHAYRTEAGRKERTLRMNTINKWAQGIGDTLATSLLCEALGRGTPPIADIPCLKMDLVRHPVFKKNMALLCKCGVRMLYQPERYRSSLMVSLGEVLNALHQVK
jgi:phosphopantothenoylcysteine decarboxylase